METAFERLDSSTTVDEANSPLNWLARLTTESLSRERPLSVLEILHGLAEREQQARNEVVGRSALHRL